MAISAEVAEDAAAAKAAAAAKRRPGGGRRAPAPTAAAAAQSKSPVVALYDRLKDLFRDHYGVVRGLRGAPQPDDGDDADAAEAAAVAEAWAPVERRLQELALAGKGEEKQPVWGAGSAAA